MKNTVTSLMLLLALACGQRLSAQTTPSAVASFTLVSADTNLDIRAVASGDSLDLAVLPTRNLNIRANTSPATVGSVVFALSGAETHNQTETTPPYALFSDLGGAYNAWTPAAGRYTLTATPYSGAGGAGTAGTPLTITFKVVSHPSILAVRGPQPGAAGPLRLLAYPNPSADGRYQLALPEAVRGPISYSLLSVLGEQVAAGTLLLAQPTAALTLDFSRQLPAKGLYYVRLQGPALHAEARLVRF